MDWSDYTQGGIGAVVGSVLTVLGFRGRLNSLEDKCEDLKEESHAMFKEIRADIKKLLSK